MRGIVLLGQGELEIREFPDPVPGPQEVVVRVKTAAICGSDIHMYHAPKRQDGKSGLIAGHEPARRCRTYWRRCNACKTRRPSQRISLHRLGQV